MTEVLTDEVESSSEHLRVVEFRRTWLLHAGYKPKNARKIAHETSIDWHFACELHDRCSDESLCMKILF